MWSIATCASTTRVVFKLNNNNIQFNTPIRKTIGCGMLGWWLQTNMLHHDKMKRKQLLLFLKSKTTFMLKWISFLRKIRKWTAQLFKKTHKNGVPASRYYYVKEKKTTTQFRLSTIEYKLIYNGKSVYVRSACNTHACTRHLLYLQVHHKDGSYL